VEAVVPKYIFRPVKTQPEQTKSTVIDGHGKECTRQGFEGEGVLLRRYQRGECYRNREILTAPCVDKQAHSSNLASEQSQENKKKDQTSVVQCICPEHHDN